MVVFLLGVAVYMHLFHRSGAKQAEPDTPDIPFYVYKIARITGESEYQVFQKCAEDWPVSAHMVEEDFKAYLLEQRTPCYVNDFVRRNRHHIDAIRMPPV